MSGNPEDKITELEGFIGHRVCTTLMVIGAEDGALKDGEWNKRIGEAVKGAYDDYYKRDKTQRHG